MSSKTVAIVADPCIGEPELKVRLKLDGIKRTNLKEIKVKAAAVTYRHLVWEVGAFAEEQEEKDKDGHVKKVVCFVLNVVVHPPGSFSQRAKNFTCSFGWGARILGQKEPGNSVLWEERFEGVKATGMNRGASVDLLTLEEVTAQGLAHEDSILLEININADFPGHMGCALEKRSQADLSARVGDFLNSVKGAVEDSDMTLVAADGKKFKAHQLILKARSPYFKAMLSTKMVEAKTRQVKMEDISGEALSVLMHHIYRPDYTLEPVKLKLSAKALKELVNAAEKCQFDDFKEDAACALVKELTRDNAYEMLGFFMRYNLTKLVAQVCAYMFRLTLENRKP